MKLAPSTFSITRLACPRADMWSAIVSSRRGWFRSGTYGIVSSRGAAIPAAVRCRDLFESGREVPSYVERDDALVATDANMVFATHIKGVFDVSQYVCGRRGPARVQKRHEIDAHHTTVLGQQPQRRVILAPGMIEDGSASRVRKRDRATRRSNTVKRRAWTAVGEVDQNSPFVQAVDYLDSELAQAAIVGGQAPGADLVHDVVGELDDAHAEFVELLDAPEVVFDRHRVLEPENQTEFLTRFRISQVCNGANANERRGIRYELTRPSRDSSAGIVEGTAIDTRSRIYQ